MDRNRGQYGVDHAPQNQGPRAGQYGVHPSGQYAMGADQASPGYGQAQPQPSSSGQSLPQSTHGPYGAHPPHVGSFQPGMPQSFPAQGGQPYAPAYATGGYAPGFEAHASYAPQPGMPYGGAPMPGMPGVGFPQPPALGPSIFSNPFSMFSTVANMGQNMQAGQQYVQNKVSWFTGGLFQRTFHVDASYVQKKLLLLMAPYLRRYDFLRVPESVGGQVVMKAPRYDLYAPDLYVPFVSMLTYVVMVATTRFMSGEFKPDIMYNAFSWASTVWFVNFCIVWGFTRAMALAAPPSSLEIASFSGYAHFYYCLTMLVGWVLGRGLAWHAAWLYTSFCMASLLIRTFKQMLRMDPAYRGVGAGRSVLYLLLILGGVQCALAWLMSATVHLPASRVVKAAAAHVAAAGGA